MVSNFEVSWVPITEDLVRQVAERCKMDEARVQTYLRTNEQNNELLRAFLFFGVGPLNKTLTKD
jgi:hypothetical protein